MSHIRWFTLTAVLLAASLTGCKCGEDAPEGPDGGGLVCAEGKPSCNTADDCPERHICRADKTTGAKCCERAPRKCEDKVDCCPGQNCTSEGRCVDSFDECDDDSDCGELGDRVCSEWTDPSLGVTRRCSYKRCGAGGACPSGQFCFADFCVAAAPCGGACAAGEACVPQNNKCHPFGDRCSLTPKPGFMVVFTDPGNVYDVCLLSDMACTYAELPPVPTDDLGRHASIATGDGKVHVAQYDGLYGDLVVTDFDTQGTQLKATWVDGVPENAPVIASPAGPRGGVVEPGQDVGKYTDIAAKADGTLYVAYYDQSQGDLRFAERAADGSWKSPYAVDGTDADLGLFNSIALDDQGRPAIAYFQRAASETSTASCPAAPGAPKSLLTALKIARANTDHPRAAGDWTIETVACAARPAPPCLGCATASASTVCVVDAASPSGTRCETPGTGCSGCASNEVCLAGGACAVKGNPAELEGIPAGVGLFPSLAFKAGTPVIAWYDALAGNLVASEKSGSSWSSHVLDGEEGGVDTGNVGLYPSLAIDGSGNFAIAYHDFTRRGLRYYSSATLAPIVGQASPAPERFIDRGLSDPALDGPSFVGADVSLIFTSAGAFAAYQNSTAADLRLAKLTAEGWSVSKEWTEGAVGFFADLAESNGKLYVVHARIQTKIADGKPARDNQLRLEVVTP